MRLWVREIKREGEENPRGGWVEGPIISFRIRDLVRGLATADLRHGETFRIIRNAPAWRRWLVGRELRERRGGVC